MPHHYNVKLTLDPVKQALISEVKLVCHIPEETKQLEFILHKGLKVHGIKAAGLSSFTSIGPTSFPFTPEAITWRLEFANTLQPDTKVTIAFHYRGDPPEPMYSSWEVNRLTKEWVEIGMYGPWFPWNPRGGSFSYEIELLMNPQYIVAATGQVTKQGKGHWHISSMHPVEDMTISAGPDLIIVAVKAGKAHLSIYHVEGETLSALQTLKDDGIWLLEFYQKWFGDEGKERHLDVVVAPRDKGGGYARPGFIVLSDLSGYAAGDGNRLFRFIAHEFAHLWWTGASVDTWEDWLNESFAEYSALVALREKHGEEALGEILTKRRSDLPALPPIKGISRTAEKAFETLYFKGSLLLLDLADLIGTDKMHEILRRRLRDQVMNTADFLVLLAEIAGEKAAQQFDSWLS